MSFTDVLPNATSASADYSAQFNGNLQQPNVPANGNFQDILFPNAIYGSSYLNSNGYQVPLGAVQDAVSLTFTAKANIALFQPIIGNITYYIALALFKNGTQITTGNFSTQNTIYTPTITYTTNIISPNDIYTLKINVIENQVFQQGSYAINTRTFTINQSPIYTPPLPITTGVNSIWQYYNTSSYPNVITSSVPELIQFYNDPDVKMVNLVGSGFNPIQFPWSIKYGDEFRFEGREDFVYQVGKIFGPSDSGSGRLTQTGSIEVHFNYDLPVSASSSAFNLDHFLIRRYVDDATTAIIEGFAPAGSTGPYIIKPEFVVPELDKDIDSFILDLTQKGLI
jgi:hypothetical protein